MFTAAEVQKLNESPYVENVTPNAITYGEVFEREYHRLIQEGHSHDTCFDLLGLDPDIMGNRRIRQYHYRYKQHVAAGTLSMPHQPAYRSVPEELDSLRHQVQLLAQENEFLKKKRHLSSQRQREMARKPTTFD